MPSPNTITAAQFSRPVGLAGAPAIVDLRIDEDLALDPACCLATRRARERAQ